MSEIAPLPQIPFAPRAERIAVGRALRERVAQAAHAQWQPAPDRPDPIALLEASNRDRLAPLLPIRYGRMVASPLAFLRGSAGVMAADLAQTPTTGIHVQICGDCHLQNFGFFASPERHVVFDVNDFDETHLGPWEWDVKRLAASVAVAARQNGADEDAQRSVARTAVKSYRRRLAEFSQLTSGDLWYVRLNAEFLIANARRRQREKLQQIVEKAQLRTVNSLLPKLTEQVAGQLRLIDQPPLIFHAEPGSGFAEEVRYLFQRYRKTLQDDRRELLDRFRLVDVAYKVVGVGSVGLRCYMALLLDADGGPLLLQIKEAGTSVLEPLVGPSPFVNHGQRIVHGQRMMQAVSDPFLGWAAEHGGRDYYVRQLRDMKTSVDVATMTYPELQDYVRLCGWALARAHAKSGAAATISGYLGTDNQFDRAVAIFALAYAEQTVRDHAALQAAVQSGRLAAEIEPRVG